MFGKYLIIDGLKIYPTIDGIKICVAVGAGKYNLKYSTLTNKVKYRLEAKLNLR